MEKRFSKELAEFFKTYPQEQECVLVGDGQIFTKKALSYARMHAKNSGQKMITVTRSGAVSGTELASEGGDDSNKSAAPATTELPNISRFNKAQLIDYAAKIGLELPDEQKALTNTQLRDLINAKLESPAVEDESENGSEGADQGEGAEGGTEGEDKEFTPTNTEE